MLGDTNGKKRKQLLQYHHFMDILELKCCQCIHRNGFWWPKMRQVIKEKQQKCIKCASFDAVVEGFHLSKFIAADQPWDCGEA